MSLVGAATQALEAAEQRVAMIGANDEVQPIDS